MFSDGSMGSSLSLLPTSSLAQKAWLVGCTSCHIMSSPHGHQHPPAPRNVRPTWAASEAQRPAQPWSLAPPLQGSRCPALVVPRPGLTPVCSPGHRRAQEEGQGHRVAFY